MGSRREEPPGCQESVNYFGTSYTYDDLVPETTTFRSYIRLWRRLASLLKGRQTRRVGYSNTESSGAWSSLGRRLALALRAERRRPEVDRVRRDELLSARHAGLAAAAVHLQLELESAFLARAGAVVTHRRPGRLHGPVEHAGHRGVQAGELVEGQLVRGLRRIDPRLEQRFVRVDIADAGDAALVHDRLLDRRPRAFEALGEHERRERIFERFGADAAGIVAPAAFVEQPQRAEAAHVAVDQEAAVVDGAGEHRVLGLVAGEGAVVHHQRACHPGLHDQAVAARQAEHRVFRAADHFLDGVASEGAEQSRLRHPTQHVRLGQSRPRVFPGNVMSSHASALRLAASTTVSPRPVTVSTRPPCTRSPPSGSRSVPA